MSSAASSPDPGSVTCARCGLAIGSRYDLVVGLFIAYVPRPMHARCFARAIKSWRDGEPAAQ